MQGLLLVDHGSRRVESNEQLDIVVFRVQQLLGDKVRVAGAHMELAAPDIAEQVSALIAGGVTDIVVVPYMLAPGRHATADIPRLAEEAAKGHSNVVVRVAQCLGVDDLLAQLTIRRAVEAGLQVR